MSDTTYEKLHEYTEGLEKLLKEAGPEAKLSFESVYEYMKTIDDMEYIIHELASRNIRLQIGSEDGVDPEYLLFIMKEYTRLCSADIRRRQKEGIRKALRKKEEGRGSYGRPVANLPYDFEKRIMDIVNSNGTLIDYQKKTKLPKSTFYKYANKVIATCK